MAQRNPRREPSNILEEPTTTEVADTIYNPPVHQQPIALESNRIVAKPTDIFSIINDPTQPRRPIPSPVRQYWDGQVEHIPQLLETWVAFAQDELKSQINIQAFIEQTEELGELNISTPTTFSLMELLKLAGGIKRIGLQNPITVTSQNAKLVIETGERRWLAYHLLYAIYQKPEWRKIPAREMKAANPWAQADENSNRQTLTAIGKARQFSRLLMYLYQEQGQTFEVYDNLVPPGTCDRTYYAQVQDEKRYRIPYGKNEQIMQAIGVQQRMSISRYRSMLTLPDEAWTIGDDYAIPEDTLYEWTTLDSKDAVLQAQSYALNLLQTQAQKKAGAKKPHASQATSTVSPGTKKHFSQITRYVTKAGSGKDKVNQAALQKLEELETWISQEKQRIRSYLT